MAHFWERNDDGVWVDAPLVEATCPLVDDGARAVRLCRLPGTPDGWAIVTNDSASVRVNGAPLGLGIALLADRDEIRALDRVVWFSTETRPAVEPFPASVARGSCPRCTLAIEPGSAAVRCPACGLWHHMAEELACWTYADCAGCGRPTAMDQPWRWTPGEL